MSNIHDAPSTITLDAAPWTLDDGLDAEAIAAMTRWLADPLVARAMNRPVTLARADLIAGFRKSIAGRGWLMFLRHPTDRKPVGYALVEVDPGNGVARLDFIVGDASTDPRGALDSMVLALGPWLFETQRIRKIAVEIRDTNHTMRAWLDGVMTLEGVMREHFVDGAGRSGDMMAYGVLQSEWRQSIAHIQGRPWPKERRRDRDVVSRPIRESTRGALDRR